MNHHVQAKRIAAILPIVILALAVGMHTVFAKQHLHRAPGPRTNADPRFLHHAAPDRPGHLIGWVNHLIGPFTSIAANL